MAKAKEYDELNISQLPAIELLQKLGYIHLAAPEVASQRGNLYNVLLKDILRGQLEKLNGFTYKKTPYQFSEKNIRQAMQDIDEALTDGLIKTNEKIYDSLLLGRSYQENLPDGTKRSFNLKFIDRETPENNLFHVVDEFTVEREDGQGTARPDIVLFVNGIPLAVIECKKALIGIIGTLRHYHSNIIELFSPVKNKQDSEEYEVLLADDEQRELFYEHLCGFGKHLAISLESEQVYHALKPEEVPENIRYSRGYLQLTVKDRSNVKRKETMVNQWFRTRTEKIFSEVLEGLFPVIEKYGIEKPTIMIRSMKARWGSCVYDKRIIILNSELIKAPKYCIEYVVLHELVHFRYPSHNAEFYGFLASLMPDWKERKIILDEEVIRGL